jgi:DNA-directed RNA polymerase subunit beta'
VAIGDLLPGSEKRAVVDDAQRTLAHHESIYRRGLITGNERDWKRYDEIQNARDKLLAKAKFPPVIEALKACGHLSRDQYGHLACMVGHSLKPNLQIRSMPIFSAWSEGLCSAEYWMAATSARRSRSVQRDGAGKALHLWHGLARALRGVRIVQHDCGTTRSVRVPAGLPVPLDDLLAGRTSAVDVRDPLSDEVVVGRNQAIARDAVRRLASMGLDALFVRSPATCEAAGGVCQLCYGQDAQTGDWISLDSAVGLKAALVMGRRFHEWNLGTAATWPTPVAATWSQMDSLGVQKSGTAGVVRWLDVHAAPESANRWIVVRPSRIAVLDRRGRVRAEYCAPEGALLAVGDNEEVRPGTILYEWDPLQTPILSDVDATARLADCVDGVTCERRVDGDGTVYRLITRHTTALRPRLLWCDAADRVVQCRFLPAETRLLIEDGAAVSPGARLATRSLGYSPERAIQQGLPAFAALVSGEPPVVAPAVLSPIGGTVSQVIKQSGGGPQSVEIMSTAAGTSVTVAIPRGEWVRVQAGDKVDPGDKLTSRTAIAPQDVLDILGVEALAEHLRHSLQAQFRANGLLIDDRHFEVLIGRMLSLPADGGQRGSRLANIRALTIGQGFSQILSGLTSGGTALAKAALAGYAMRLDYGADRALASASDESPSDV